MHHNDMLVLCIHTVLFFFHLLEFHFNTYWACTSFVFILTEKLHFQRVRSLSYPIVSTHRSEGTCPKILDFPSTRPYFTGVAQSKIVFCASQLDIWLLIPQIGRFFQIHFCVENPFFVTSLTDQIPISIGYQRFTGKLHVVLCAYPVAHSDGYRILKCLHPDLPLKHREWLCIFVNGRHKNQIGTHQCFCPDTLRIMPVKANHDSYPAYVRIEHMESVIGWRVVILLVEMLRLRDMYHLLDTDYLAVKHAGVPGIIL